MEDYRDRDVARLRWKASIFFFSGIIVFAGGSGLAYYVISRGQEEIVLAALALIFIACGSLSFVAGVYKFHRAKAAKRRTDREETLTTVSSNIETSSATTTHQTTNNNQPVTNTGRSQTHNANHQRSNVQTSAEPSHSDELPPYSAVVANDFPSVSPPSYSEATEK